MKVLNVEEQYQYAGNSKGGEGNSHVRGRGLVRSRSQYRREGKFDLNDVDGVSFLVNQ